MDGAACRELGSGTPDPWEARLKSNTPDVAVKPPPAGFDPLRAERNQLLRYGFPLPDEARSAEVVRIWRRSLDRGQCQNDCTFHRAS